VHRVGFIFKIFNDVTQRTTKIKSTAFLCGHSTRICNKWEAHHVERYIGSPRNKYRCVRGVLSVRSWLLIRSLFLYTSCQTSYLRSMIRYYRCGRQWIRRKDSASIELSFICRIAFGNKITSQLLSRTLNECNKNGSRLLWEPTIHKDWRKCWTFNLIAKL